ncbi:EcoKI restriction-modification system protein HsdS [Marinomonas spartinae]|uniref:restriction endonuclease subunit S n=1 Tax=Marinomonas spartinae TaxID=1792290 RepID=UPI000808B7A3|nr:restriction endonuclease subunit S [Marinomonas spartinae]SBS25464.1 EcoKI restriction-modification system protein HsdS [Marinomonas spartinae]
MSNLKKHRFCDLYTMSSGISSTKDQAGHGSPFLSFSVVFNNYFVPDALPDLMDTSDKEKETYSIKAGDIFLTRTSEVVDELAMSCVAVKDYPNASYSGFLKRLRPTQTDITYSKFMAFYLRSPMFRKTMTNNAVMTLRASLNKAIFSYLNLLLPEYNEQVKAGDLLYLLNEKIELNNRINAELEAMAKTLYDYWFVQFDFPDDSPQGQGKPYKTSGGKMVYNPTLKREIPQGWELVPIEYFADVIDPHPSHRAPREVEIGFPFAGIGDIDEAGNISTSKARQIDEEFVLKQERDYEIGEYSLGYGRVGTVGKVVRLKKQKFRYALSPTLSVINPKKPEYAGYVYTVVKSDEFYKHVIKNTSGTTRPAVGIQLLRKIPVLKPGSAHNNMFEKYEEITKELFEKSSIANQENQNLIELRDWLLPMLMNGQVTVK